MQGVYQDVSANLDKICGLLRQYVDECGSYTKAADKISEELGLVVDGKSLERLAKGKYLENFEYKLYQIVGCGELFGVDLVSKKDGKSVAEDKLDRIRKILDE